MGHTNLATGFAKGGGRAFKSLEEMEKTIIRNHNSRVKPEDVVFHVGDFAFGDGRKYLPLLNGHIIFIRGNHDGNNHVPSIIDRMVIDYGGFESLLIHNPDEANLMYKRIICGHVHERWKTWRNPEPDGNIFVNVGVDVWGFKPVSWQEVEKAYNEAGKGPMGAC